MAYAERAPAAPATRTLVALHGGTNDMNVFAPSLHLLNAPPDVRVLIPELLGHGERIEAALANEHYEFTDIERGADLGSFLESVPGVLGGSEASVDLLGYSLGGLTALTYLGMTPEHMGSIRRVALIAAGLAATDEVESETAAGLYRYAYRDVAEATAFADLIGIESPSNLELVAPVLATARSLQAVPDDYWASMWVGVRYRSVIGESDDGVQFISSALAGADALAAAGVPTLVLQGSSDRVIHAAAPRLVRERFEAAGRGDLCRTVLLEGYGHGFHLTREPPERIFDNAFGEVASFLGHDEE